MGGAYQQKVPQEIEGLRQEGGLSKCIGISVAQGHNHIECVSGGTLKHNMQENAGRMAFA